VDTLGESRINKSVISKTRQQKEKKKGKKRMKTAHKDLSSYFSNVSLSRIAIEIPRHIENQAGKRQRTPFLSFTHTFADTSTPIQAAHYVQHTQHPTNHPL
jgi:hypothetical protein